MTQDVVSIVMPIAPNQTSNYFEEDLELNGMNLIHCCAKYDPEMFLYLIESLKDHYINMFARLSK